MFSRRVAVRLRGFMGSQKLTSLDYSAIKDLLTGDELAVRDRTRRFLPEEVLQRIVPCPHAVALCLLFVLFPCLTGSTVWAQGDVAVDAFVNWDFKHRKKLPGWVASAQAIRRTVDLWYPGKTKWRAIENGTPSAITQFVATLPTSESCATSIVYFGSHQSATGEWHFTQREIARWDSILERSDRHPKRIVIVDACSAAAATRFNEWKVFAPFSLLASDIGEDTAQLNFDSPQPIDLRRRFPEVSAWLRVNLDNKWDGKLSFLGFVWVKAFLLTPDAPKSDDDWSQFLRLCERVALDFREKTNRRFASRVTALAQP